MLKDINALAPTIRIMPGAPAIFMTPFIFITLALVSVLNSIPCNDSILRKFDKALSIIFTLGISSALVSLIFITPLQYYAMPKLGYTRCNILEGHPTIYFTDWVKSPNGAFAENPGSGSWSKPGSPAVLKIPEIKTQTTWSALFASSGSRAANSPQNASSLICAQVMSRSRTTLSQAPIFGSS